MCSGRECIRKGDYHKKQPWGKSLSYKLKLFEYAEYDLPNHMTPKTANVSIYYWHAV